MLDNLQIIPMNRAVAAMIVNWKYPPPYELYSFSHSEDDLQELLNGEYYAVLRDHTNASIAVDSHDHIDIAGYFCLGESARVPGGYRAGIYTSTSHSKGKMIKDIGLGLHPALTGKGLGEAFLQYIFQHINKHYGQIALRLVVLKFNQRAIKVYKRIGFQEVCSFPSPVNGEMLEFVCMTHEEE